ncbi:MAG: sialidase family protein [Cellulosilyticaceae bacterium]
MRQEKKQVAYRSKDYMMFASTNPNKLASPTFVGDEEMVGDIKGCRIPSLINARDPEGGNVMIAAADVGNDGADWGCVSLAIRRSYDDGKTWTKLQKVISLQAHHAPQAELDWQAPFVIDPLMVQAEDGTIIVMIDMFPECQGFRSSHWMEHGTGYQEIDGKHYLVLCDGESRVGDHTIEEAGNRYTVREEGWVYDQQGNRTRYYMPQKHDGTHGFSTLGDLYYAVGEPDYLTTEPPLLPQVPMGNQDIYVGNVFMSFEKPAFVEDEPRFVQKRIAGPKSQTHSDYEVIETDPAPLRAMVTSYLWVTSSKDGGRTWEQPVDITAQVKIEEDGLFLGVGPGVGCVLNHQTSDKNGRILMPLYNVGSRANRATVIYSDDQGKTWTRTTTDGGFCNNKDESQCIELYNGTVVIFGRQEGKGDTPIAYSIDGGETWSAQTTTALKAVKCQKSVITYPIDEGKDPMSPFAYPEGMTPGKQYVLASHPTGEAGYTRFDRSDGTISLGEVQEDNSIKWIAHKKLAIDGQYDAADEECLRNFFAYSCLCVLDNGDIGILYEPQPVNYLAYASFSLAWILE